MRPEFAQRAQPAITDQPDLAASAIASTRSARPDASVSARIEALLTRHATLLRYAAIGFSGYVVYLGLLFVMYDLALFPFLPGKGQAVSLLLFTHSDALLLITTLLAAQASICVVFAGHSLWTFSKAALEQKPLWLRFVQFEVRALASTLGILTVTVNVAVLAGVHHYVALPTGIIATFTWNWLWDSRFIWRKERYAS